MGLIQLPKDTNFFNKNIHNIFKSGNFENVWNGKLKNLVNKITVQKDQIFCSNGAGLFTILQIYKEYYGRKKF